MVYFIDHLDLWFSDHLTDHKNTEDETENQLMQSYMASMEIFYDGIQNQIEATRRYRHDLANHIQTLEACLVLYSDTEEMREYMDNLKDRYHTLKNQEFSAR